MKPLERAAPVLTKVAVVLAVAVALLAVAGFIILGVRGWG